MISKSFYFLAEGDFKSASQLLESGLNHPLVSIIKAVIEFGKKNYKECLNTLRQILLNNPRSPPCIRFAMGVCFFRLGITEKARIAFKRVIELDPSYSMAYTALAIVEIST
jgi:RNA polymerase-associated protein CTR9